MLQSKLENMKKLFLIFTLVSVIYIYPQLDSKYTVNINGTLRAKNIPEGADNFSENGTYSFTYKIGEVTDEMRRLYDYKLFKNGIELFSLSEVPGSDVMVSDNGYSVFFDHSLHFDQKLTLNICSPEGKFVFSKQYRGASGFTFSDGGNFLLVRRPGSTDLAELSTGVIREFPEGLASFYLESSNILVIADESFLMMYQAGELKFKIQHNIGLIRRIAVSSAGEQTAIISGNKLSVFNNVGTLLWERNIEYGEKYRDIRYDGDMLIVGTHIKDENSSRGLIRIFNVAGKEIQKTEGKLKTLPPVKKVNLPAKSSMGYEPIPWPFAPFDSARIVWNHYEQHMGYGGSDTSSYLHQGLDLIVPIAEPTYAVKGGIVKCVLTLGGASYWRLAISDSQNSGVSDGWLYAHLIQSSIQVDIGDTVQQFDHLADIVAWTSTWAHIHFVQIRDSGTVWLYSDNEWGINFSPLFAITPLNDIQPPHILPVFQNSKFAFTQNETNTFLSSDSLFGVIDIIVKTADSICGSEWQQPATSVFYEIKNLSTGQVVKPKTLGHILNHAYQFYGSGSYEPFAGVIYKRSPQLLPSSWMSITRNYFHNLTNSNGDSLITLQERELGLDTRNFNDGYYLITVTAYDPSGNMAADSMVIRFVNGITSVNEESIGEKYWLGQNFPNPFYENTTIRYNLSQNPETKGSVRVTLKLFDLLGREVATLVDEEQSSGLHQVSIGKEDLMKLSSGLYIYRLTVGDLSLNRKMIFVK